MDLKPQINTDIAQIGPTTPDELTYPPRDLTQQIIGAAMEVHRNLGPGFLEKVYENALVHELGTRGIKSTQQVAIPVYYKESLAGTYACDLLVEQAVICELKTADAITAQHQAQLLHYLKATGVKVGLLLNFGTKSLQVKRLVF